MAVYTFNDMRNHIGHRIVCVGYGDKRYTDHGELANVSVKCETCGVVLFDLNQGDHYEKFLCIDNPIKNLYPDGVCPDCSKEIPDDVSDGDSCSNCGHVFHEPRPDDK